MNRKVCAALLNRLGATVECVCGGEEAMNSVRNKAPDMQFDLIFMDIQMPEVTSLKPYQLIDSSANLCVQISTLRTLLKPSECPSHGVHLLYICVFKLKYC